MFGRSVVWPFDRWRVGRSAVLSVAIRSLRHLIGGRGGSPVVRSFGRRAPWSLGPLGVDSVPGVRAPAVRWAVCFRASFGRGMFCLGHLLQVVLSGLSAACGVCCTGYVLSQVCSVLSQVCSVAGMACPGYVLSRVWSIAGMSCLGYVLARVCPAPGTSCRRHVLARICSVRYSLSRTGKSQKMNSYEFRSSYICAKYSPVRSGF